MNSIFFILIAILIYLIFYFFWGKKIEKKVIKVNNSIETPAKRLKDKIDYVPSNAFVLFGHHFASIAGAGPIIGPAIAMAWGWAPALIWIWFGNIMIGAVHDYLSLMISVRHDGKSIQWVAGKIIRGRTGTLFQWFILFTLVLVIGAFSAVIGKVFQEEQIVPTAFLFTTFIAIFMGFAIYKYRFSLSLTSIIAFLFLLGAFLISLKIPLSFPYHFWLVVLAIYIIIASTLPVWVLLQPRDYLNTWFLWLGLILAAISLIIGRFPITTPSFTMWSASVIAGKPSPFWPIIPLIIACGSLSGFHSLVASGTTSKQLDKESSGLFVGFGSMLTEGFLSTIVVICIGAFGFSVLKENISNNAIIFGKQYVSAIDKIGGPVQIFSNSYALCIHNSLKFSKEFMVLFASLWISAFALTSLDTSNRLARFVIQELSEGAKTKLNFLYRILQNRLLISSIPAILGIYLAWGGAWSVLWPAFAGANQMLASIALITVSFWVLQLNISKVYKVLILLPALFLWTTVTLALVWFLFYAIPHYFLKNPVQSITLSIISGIMIILNLLLLFDFIDSLYKTSS